METKRSVLWTGGIVAIVTLICLSVSVWAENMEKQSHPDLSEQEMYVACSDCHNESTPELQKEWYDSTHGIAMVKCYQCHGTFETFKVTPSRSDCATCHADQLNKCAKDKKCWECHMPHSFKKK